MNTQNNKLIAEFLGWTLDNPSTFPTELHQEKEIQGFWELRFDTDWNWLMEVVEKIEKIQRSKWSKNTYPCISISAISCKISFYGNTEEIISNIIRPSKKQAIYDACVEFIKWYNKKN